jgi:hypothetical protein
VTVPLHPDRVEIVRYLLSRGLDPIELVPSAQEMAPMMAAMAAATTPPK